jgi:CrcB protein
MTVPVLLGLAVLGGVGAVLRRLIDGALGDRTESRLPFGILVVNLSGAFALGVLTGAGASAQLARLLGTGLLGGYTTFSAWMLGGDRLARRGRAGRALGYLMASLLGGLALVWLGRRLGTGLCDAPQAMFHVEIRQFPHSARAFNLGRAELEPLLRGWLAGTEVHWGERDWQPKKAKLVILEGAELDTSEIGMGRGWPEAQRRSREVTDELLRSARVTPALPDARPLLRQLMGEAPAPLGELVGLLTGAGVDARAADAAVWALLQAGELELVRPPAR